ncbi:glycine cleavage system aminomethyltransferase GcvT [Candidatus Gracilibacteria bacterium]|nr:glycine cleavage system aminomethyltransferase GcvT [Candidatus Gracilibacteria bacterium]NJM89586.1 glycine cleavage system aminomethyltransferase GcvT [Hydrococcus sp. RU_2_2]NJP21261.1 glycine cleavage system aminomethyltransferase GcvT [Hydrococcus sp. CRU_1_1]
MIFLSPFPVNQKLTNYSPRYTKAVAKSETSSNLARTPLYEIAIAQKARMVPFSGWEMPVQFSGLKQEHETVRKAVGMFDISHMGKFFLRGKELLKSFQPLVPSDLERLQPTQAQYTVLLNPQAGIIDDIIFYYQGEDKTGEQHGVLIVNAATTSKDKAWLLEHLDTASVQLQDVSQEKALIAIQGPQALTSLQSFVKDDLSAMKAFGHIQTTVLDSPAFIARTGYTGEDGFEVMVDAAIAQMLWRSLAEAGVTPCGLGARDTLRLEAAMCLYGQDIDDTTTPLEAGLGWLVHLDSKGDFIGRSVLEKQKASGVERRLVGLQMEGRHIIARHGYPILSEGKAIGEVASGTLSPTLDKAIALAYVPTHLSKIGQSLNVEIRGKTYPATVVKKPFYRSPSRL